MEKNPFSFYDFLGYLFPGMLTLLIVIHITYLKEPSSISDYFSIAGFMHTFKNELSIEWWKSTLILIILSYICGQIIAYLSSVTIEYFANKLYKYPSYYLLHDEDRSFDYYLNTYFWDGIYFGNFIWRIILFFIAFPVTLFILLLGAPLKINKFITHPLDAYIRDSIQTKLFNLSQKLNLARPEINSDNDYHRIVMHYVYLNIPNCQRKTDNHIALYGFLRAICLISCIFTDILIIKGLSTINFSASFDWKGFVLIITMAFLSNILFMGFVKFYRRFTLENYMALLTEKNS